MVELSTAGHDQTIDLSFQRNFYVGINEFKYEFNPEWTNATQTMTKGANFEVRQNFEIVILKDVVNNLLVFQESKHLNSPDLHFLRFQVSFKIDKMVKSGRYEPTFVNFKREACEVLKMKNIVFDSIASSLKKLGVMPNRCPIKKV